MALNPVLWLVTFLLVDSLSQACLYMMHIPKCCVDFLRMAILVNLVCKSTGDKKNQKKKSIQYGSHETEVSNTPNVGGFNMFACIVCSVSRAGIMKQLSDC